MLRSIPSVSYRRVECHRNDVRRLDSRCCLTRFHRVWTPGAVCIGGILRLRWSTLSLRRCAVGGYMAKRSRKRGSGFQHPGGVVLGRRAHAEVTTAGTSAIESFAEDLGRLLGTARAKAESWLGQRQNVAKQLEQIRDTAAGLLSQLTGVPERRRRGRAKTPQPVVPMGTLPEKRPRRKCPPRRGPQFRGRRRRDGRRSRGIRTRRSRACRREYLA